MVAADKHRQRLKPMAADCYFGSFPWALPPVNNQIKIGKEGSLLIARSIPARLP
jgi:hypothetical protein